MSDLENQIREAAYHLWNAAGRPDGQNDAFWLSAQRELLAEAAKPAKPSAKTAAAPKKKAKSARAKAA